jgi:branched-subunit amino acid transport protein
MDLRIWFVILAAGIITYLIRLSFIIALERLKLPDWFLRGLRYVPPAVLSAIIVPELANWNGQAVNLTWNNPQIIAGMVAVLVAWWTRNMFLTLIFGLICFFVLRIWM